MKNFLSLIIFCLLLTMNVFLFAQQKSTNSNPKQVLVLFQDENSELYGYKDSITNKIIIPAKYVDAKSFSEGLGLVNIGGRIEYDEVDGESYTIGGKWGYINSLDSIVIPAKYDLATPFLNHSAIVAIKSQKESIYKEGIINTKGIVIVPIQYDELSFADNDLFYALSKGLYGIIDNKGIVKIPLKYNDVKIVEGLVIATLNEKEGILNLNNQIVLPIENKNVFYEAEDDFFWIIVSDSNSYYFHKSGISFDTKTDFKYGLAIVSKNKKYGLIDKNVKFIAPLNYDFLDIYYSGQYIQAKKNNKNGYITTKGIEIVPCIYDWISLFTNEIALAKNEKKYCYIDTSGRKISNIYDNVYIFNFQKDMVMIEVNHRYGIFNTNEKKEITPPKYDWIGEFYDDMARVLIESTLDTVSRKFIGGKYGYINKNGEEVIPPIYSEASNFKGGIATVKLNGNEIKISKNGKPYIKQYSNICEAINNSDIDAIKDFLNKDVDVNKKYSYESKGYDSKPYISENYPVYVLINKNHYGINENDCFELAKLFMKKGLNLENQRFMLYYLINNYYGKPENVLDFFKFLETIHFDFNFTFEDNTNLINRVSDMYPCEENLAKFLLERGVDPSLKNNDGKNAIKNANKTICDSYKKLIKSYKK